jgi:hypothetical protein
VRVGELRRTGRSTSSYTVLSSACVVDRYAVIRTSLNYTVLPVLNGISRVQNIFLLKPGFRLIKVYYNN